MNRLICFLSVLLCVIISRNELYAQSIYMKHYTINDGLAGNHVYMCHQDLNGYMWVATTSGLSRFDGKKFKNYDYEDGLQDNEILFVTNDSANNIWVRAFSAISSISVIKNDSYRGNKPSSILTIPTANVNISNEYYSARNKTAYLNGSASLVIIKNNTPSFIRASLTPGSAVFETEDGKIFSGDDRNLYSIRDTTVSLFQSLGLSKPYSRLYYYGGLLYVVINNTILLYQYNQKEFIYQKTIVLPDKINLIHVNRYGVWVAYTDKKGLRLFPGHTHELGSIDVRIPGFVNHFADDKEGGMWISATDNGVYYLPNPGMISYTAADGLASSVVYTVEPLSVNQFWLGYNTGNAELVTLQNRILKVNQKISLGDFQYSNNEVLDIVHSKNNRVYFLSRNNLNIFQNNQLTSIPYNANKSLILINDSILGIGGWNYTLLNLVTGDTTGYRIGRIYAQAYDNAGNIWLGGLNGLYHLSAGKKAKPKNVKAFDGIKVNALAMSNGYLWVGTQNNGLYLLKNDSVFMRFTYKNTNGLPSNTIKALAVTNNQLWVGTNRGIMYGEFNYNKLSFTTTLPLNHNDGLLSPEVNEIKICDTNVFIATYGGITILHRPAPKRLVYKEPDVIIKNLNDNKTAEGDNITLPYSTKGLEISFHTVAFKYSGDITYKYKLEHFDNDWKNTKNNLVQYTNLPPGDYRFLIKASDNRGNASATYYSVALQIQPLFRQTIWFRLLIICMAVLVVIVILYSYYRYQQVRTNNKLLQGRLIAKARLNALKAQLKPHFIFNSLNAIKDYIYNNKNDDAADLLQGFSTLIRKGLILADNDFITIGEETAFLKQYLELERTKCDKCFEYRFDISEKIFNIVIPSLITQPFVENAVIHGVRTVKDRAAVLSVSYSLIDNDIVCRITDNGIGIKRSLQHKKIEYSRGTNISKDRIGYFKTGLGIDIALDIQDRQEAGDTEPGTIVTITIKNANQYSQNENHIQQPDN